MRYFRIVYENKNCREVWVETADEVLDKNGIEQLFFNNFERYDKESDDHDSCSGSVGILTIDEIDENGNDV